MLLPGQLRRAPAAAPVRRRGRKAGVRPPRSGWAITHIGAAQGQSGLTWRPIQLRSIRCRSMQGLGKAAQAGACRRDALHRAHQAGQGPGHAVQPWHDKDVAWLQASEQQFQPRLRAIVLWPGLLLHDLSASGIGQRPAPCIEFGALLVAVREVSDQHGAIRRRLEAGQGRARHPQGTASDGILAVRTCINGTLPPLHNTLQGVARQPMSE